MSLHSEELFGLVIELKVIRVPVIIEVGWDFSERLF
jgi:hypothetical protein